MALIEPATETTPETTPTETTPTSFLDSMPVEYRNEPYLATFKDLNGFVKSAIDTKKMVGDAALLKPLPEGSTPEQIDAWKKEKLPQLAKLGLIESAPESPEKYEYTFNDAEGNPIDQKLFKDDPVFKEYSQTAHELGLSNKQAQTLAERFYEKMLPGMFPAAPTEEQTTQALTQELGPKFKETISSAQKAVNVMNGHVPELRDWLADKSRGALGNDPVFIKTFAKIGQMLSQDSGHITEKPVGETIQSLDDKIRAIRNDATLNSQQQSERMMPLYETKAKMLNRATLKD